MRSRNLLTTAGVALILTVILAPPLSRPARAADHNDPNAANSIFSDIAPSPADLYDLFGYPLEDASGEKVVIALTFAAAPAAGTLDPDLLYRVLIAPSARVASGIKDDDGVEGMLKYFEALKDKYARLHPSEVRVTVDASGKARLQFFRLPGGDFSAIIDTNKPATLEAPGGFAIKAFVGGRDDAFFNDLPGFFRSINYAPQFYKVPLAMKEMRELKIPKTLLELEGNTLFNFNPAVPLQGQGVKLDLPPGPLTWTGTKFHKDEKGNFRFVYSGKDAQAGRNVNAIILELPLAALTRAPTSDRIVNAWGESWVLKAASKVESIPADRARVQRPLWLERPWLIPGIVIAFGVLLALLGRGRHGVWRVIAPVIGLLLAAGAFGAGMVLTSLARQRPELALRQGDLDEELQRYKLVDTDGQPFADAALNQRDDAKQLGAFNFSLAPGFVTRLAHLGWGFGPSISALGLRTSFDHSNSPVSVYREYGSGLAATLEAFPRVKKVIFQRLNMPDATWKRKDIDIPLKRPIEIFIPNVCPIDMDTTGTWPYGRRFEDQVATRFLSLFLDMSAKIDGKQVNVDTLGQQSLWDHAPIEPKTPPNPLKNDKEFLDHFPYMADPW
jgi:hypothetical protein